MKNSTQQRQCREGSVLHGGQQHDTGGGISGYSPKTGNFSQVGGDVIGISVKRENMVKNKNCR